MKTVPLTIRRCPPGVHQALKKSAEANHRSLNGEALDWLEREAESAQRRLEKAASTLARAREKQADTQARLEEAEAAARRLRGKA